MKYSDDSIEVNCQGCRWTRYYAASARVTAGTFASSHMSRLQHEVWVYPAGQPDHDDKIIKSLSGEPTLGLFEPNF